MRFLMTMALVAVAAIAFAQDPADIFHKTVDLDSINQVSLDVYEFDEFEVREWPGDDILIETSVRINNGKPHILKFFLEQNRWDLEEKISGDQLLLESRDKRRRVVQGTEGTTSETVRIVVYMPEDFSASGTHVFRRISR